MKSLGIDRCSFRRLLAIAAFVSIGLVSQGQEMIRQSIDFINCDSSIVRQFTKNIAYVYNRNKWEPRQVDIPFPYECGKPIE